MSRPTKLHALVLRPPVGGHLGLVRTVEQRITLARMAIEKLGEVTDRGVLVLPAGYLRVSSTPERDAAAATLLGYAKQAMVALIFGVDVAASESWAPLHSAAQTFAYVCEGGQPLLWPAESLPKAASARAPIRADNRLVTLWEKRVAVVLSAELFNLRHTRALCRREPDAIIVLSHTGPTERWWGPLAALERVAPTIVVGESLQQESPAWTTAPSGWCQTVVMTHADFQVCQYLEEAQAKCSAIAEVA